MKKSGINTFSNRQTRLLRVAPLLLFGLTACSTSNTTTAGQSASVMDHPQRIRMTVGTVREITLPSSTDATLILAGSSDNSEVVDVSPKPEMATQTSPARATPGGSKTFLIKAVTSGTVRLVFTEKRADDTGSGQVRKTCLVQVVGK